MPARHRKKVEKQENEESQIVRVRALKNGEHPSGIFRHSGEEFDYVREHEKLPHWMQDVEGVVASESNPSEIST